MAASRVGYINMEVRDALTLQPPRCRGSSLLFRLWAFCVLVCLGRCPTVGFTAPHGSLPVLFTSGNWHHWEPAMWAV